ncbi:MAG: DinB family protein [Gemmatimonadota bacterium]
MKRISAVAAMLVLVSAAGAHAQQAQQKASDAAVATAGMSSVYSFAKGYILKAAEQVPEDKYAYQPTKDVRTFGQLLAHITDANNFFCALIGGTPKEYSDAVEKSVTTKAQLSAELKKSFDACDAALASVKDADLVKPVEIFGNKANLAAAITIESSHIWEHYGNIVTYMRLNGMTPPSSQGGGM